MKIGNIEYASQDEKALTFVIAAGTLAGDAVSVTVAGTAGRGANNDPLYGKALLPDADGKGAVNRTGIQILKYTGTLPVGYQQLVVDGAGKVKAGTGTGRWAQVIGTDGTYAVVDLG